MRDKEPNVNWRARTLAGTYLKNEVNKLTAEFCDRVDDYQFYGGDPGPLGPSIHKLCRNLQQLDSVLDFLFWIDTAEAPQAIEEFRRRHQDKSSSEVQS